MAGGKGNIDAISVALGADLTQLRSDLRAAKSDLDKALPTKRTVHVSVQVTTPKHAVSELYSNIRNQFDSFQKGTGTQALRIAPKMTVDPRVMRDFRRDIERNMAQAGRAGQALRVPIKFNGDLRGFIASIGHVEVPVYGKWAGWSSGGGPPSGAGGGGGGAPSGRGPAGGHPFSGFRAGPSGPAGGGPGPKPARGAPAGGRAQATGGVVVQPHVYASSGGVETSSSDRYETEAPPRGGAPTGAPTARQQRQQQRRASMSGSAPPPSTPRRNVYGPGNRATTGASTNPRYTEPPGGRITVDNVRSGSTIEELQGEERAAFISQTRAGGRDFSPNNRPQATRGGRPTTPRAIERLERRRRFQTARARGQSPADIAAREHIRTGFHQLDPDLAAAFDIAGDPESRQGYGEFLESAERAREAYGTAFHGMDKKTRRQRGIARGYKKGDINAVDPTLLLFDASLDALREMQRSAVDPLYQVRSGDTKGRGPGGKVGKIGGRSAGRMASASVNPAAVQAIIERRRIGGKGNGWKTLKGEFSAEEISAAVGRIGANKARPEVEDIVPGQAYGGFMEDAPPIQGGQGAGMRPDPKPRKQATYRDLQASSDISQAGRARTPVSSLHDTVGGGTSVRSTGSARLPDLRTPGGASDPTYRTKRPPRPESRAHGRAPGGEAPRTKWRKMGVEGEWTEEQLNAFEETLRGQGFDFKNWGFAPGGGQAQPGGPRVGFNPSPKPHSDPLIAKLIAMAGQTKQSPHEAGIAASLLRSRGIPGFAEGGIIDFFADGGKRPQYGKYLGVDVPPGSVPGHILRGTFGGPVPRKGSKARSEADAKWRMGMRNREEYEKKPEHQKGGKSGGPEWQTNRRTLIERERANGLLCAYCGQPTIEGDKGPMGTTVDHKLDAASGGTHALDNLQIMHNKHNGMKSGGKMRRFAEGGSMGRRSQWKWGQGYAEGGVVKRGGLLDRMAQAGHQPSVAIVGERGREGIVTDPNTGESEVVPAHKLPAWLDRAQSGKGFGKDMTHHAEGGALKVVNMGRSGSRYQAGGSLVSEAAARTGDVSRVFVVNWPSNLGAGGGAAQAAQTRAARGAPAQAQAASPNAQAAPQASPGPGAPAGSPPVGAGRARARAVDPYDRVRAREISLAGEDRPGTASSRIQALRAQGTETLQRVPVRALSVAFGQISQTTFGGRGDILARQRGANVAAARAQRAENQYTNLRQAAAETRFKIADINEGRVQFDKPEDRDATLEQLRATATANLEARREAKGVVEKRVTAAEQKQAGVLTRGQQITSQAAGLGGIIAGTTVFTATMAAVSTAAGAAATALSPLIQSMLGWPAAIDKVTSSIRDSIQASGGQIGAGTAAAVAPSGISAAYLDSQGRNLTTTGTNRAAAAAGAEAQDITRASQGSPRGLYEGTGGLFGTNVLTELFGGQPGFLQTVEGRLKTGQVNKGLDPLGATAMMTAAVNPFGGKFLQDPFAEQDAMKRTQDETLATNVEELNRSLKSAAEYGGNAADAFQLVTKATDEQKKAMIDSAATISQEAKTRAEGIASTGVAVVGARGANLTGQQFGQYADQQARGQLIQDPALLMRASQPGRNAAAFGVTANAEFQRNEDIPAAFAMQMNARPLGRIGAGYDQSDLSPEAKKYQADSLKATQAIEEEQTKGRAALETIVSRIDRPSFAGGIGTVMDGPKGQETVRRGTAGPALTQFRSLQGQIGGLGTQIQNRVDTVQQAQATLQAHEYGEQIRLSNRALGDAQDLWAGINGQSSSTLGGLQAQNIMLDRQNQLLGRRQQRLAFKSEDIGFKSSDLQVKLQNLGFEQSQRQINFNKSVAGFAAPGSTPEERAARIQEAKLEADFAQKQLNLQIQIAAQGRAQLKIAKEQSQLARAQFGNQNQQQDNQFAITREEAKRAVTDIQNQLALLQEGHKVAIDTAAAEEAIARLQAQQQVLIDQAGVYVNQGQEVRSQVLADIQNLMKETGKGFAQLVSAVSGAWNEAFQASYTNYLKPLTQYLASMQTNPYAGGGNGPGTGAGHYADGVIGSTAGPTQFLAGEAGREHVVVLRNATQGTMMMGLGGGGGTTINVGGVTLAISGGKDMDEAKLADAVVDRLSRKLSLIGR